MTALRDRVAEWLLRRQGPQLGRVRLTQGRIYLLPTRAGVMLGATIVLMLMGCINYNLGLGYILTFLLAGVGMVSMLHTFRNLAKLEIHAGRAEPVFAGERAVFPLLVDNPTGLRRLSVAFAAMDVAVAGEGHTVWCDPAPLAQTRCDLFLEAQQRGRMHLPRLRVFTTYPLDLFHAWSYVALDASCLVYPKPETGLVRLPTPRSGAEEGLQSGRGQDDFAGLRRYVSGDSLRHVAWKAVARGQALLTKQFTGLEAGELWLSWWDLPGELRLEARLSRLTRWVVDAARAGLSFGLELPGARIAPDIGPAHEERCLSVLALFRAPSGLHTEP
jgi:uncharacterized protein (DUF58 family)